MTRIKLHEDSPYAPTLRKRLVEDNPYPVAETKASNSKYDPKFIPIAKFLSSRGAIQVELAECFGVSTRTIQNWIVTYPEFAAAVSQGNDVFNPRIERALAERAIGFYADQYVWRERSKVELAAALEAGQELERFELIPTERKYYPPDVTAQIFWNKNRLPNDWRDVQEHKHTAQLQSPEDWLKELHANLKDLQADGHLKTIELKALPAPKKKGNGKHNGVA